MRWGTRAWTALAAVVVAGLTPVGVAPAVEAAVPCSVTNSTAMAPVDLAPGESATRTFTPALPDGRTDLTLADLDVYLGFVDYAAGPQIYLDHAGRSVLLMGSYDTTPRPDFTITYDDEAPTPAGSVLAERSLPAARPATRPSPRSTAPPGAAATCCASPTRRGWRSGCASWRLVMAPDTCDSDGDGVEERSDNCPSVANPDQTDWDGDGVGNPCDATPGIAPTTPGCTVGCTYERTVGLRHVVRKRRLVGKVESAVIGCRSGVSVTIWRKRSGTDRKLVVVTTRATGKFRTKAPRKAGRYYATVGSPDQPLCSSATSRTVRVKRR